MISPERKYNRGRKARFRIVSYLFHYNRLSNINHIYYNFHTLHLIKTLIYFLTTTPHQAQIHTLYSHSPLTSIVNPPISSFTPPPIRLMSVDIRQSPNCLRLSSRYQSVSRAQLSKQHTGDNTREPELRINLSSSSLTSSNSINNLTA